MERIEIFTGEQLRRRYTPQEKAKFVAMTMQPGYSVSLVAIQSRCFVLVSRLVMMSPSTKYSNELLMHITKQVLIDFKLRVEFMVSNFSKILRIEKSKY